MSISHRSETLFLFLGDVLILYASLFLTLFFRYTSSEMFDVRIMLSLHLPPFSILFVLWLLVFFIAGLYEKHTLFLQKQLPQLLTKALLVNAVIAIGFFYFLPAFLIAPKINLFLCLFVSSILLFLWRRYGLRATENGDRESAVIIGHGDEMERIFKEINHNPLYQIKFVFSVNADSLTETEVKNLTQRMIDENIHLVVVDLHAESVSHLLPHLYNLLFTGMQFLDMHKVYEDMFDRIPLSLVGYNWFLENLSSVSSRFTYDFLKRFMDIIVSFVLGVLSLLLYPLVYVAIKLDDGGPLFVQQKRIGKNNQSVRTLKFRTMTHDDAGREDLKQTNKVTRVGGFLRRTRLDELPQLWNVFLGEMSLIGPRPELPSLVEVYEREVPYYGTRHLIKPGLSGWAQLYHKTPPKVDANANETAIKLSYDLYYLKNRSLWLDIKIALKTVKVLLSRSGV